MPVFPARFLLVGLGLRFFEIIGGLVILMVRVLGFVQPPRFIGVLVAFVVTVWFLVVFVRRAVVTLMPHTRWSSLMSVSVTMVRVTIRRRVLPIWMFPGHRRRGSMWVDETEEALPESTVVGWGRGRRRRRAEAGEGRWREIAVWWWRRRRRVSTVRRRWRRRRRRVITVMRWWRWVVTMVRRRRRTLAEGRRVREMRLLPVRRGRERMSAILGVVPMAGLSKAVMRSATVLTTRTRRMRPRPVRSVRPMRPMPLSASVD